MPNNKWRKENRYHVPVLGRNSYENKSSDYVSSASFTVFYFCEVRKNDGTVVKYGYDPLGQRIKSEEVATNGTNITEFLMSGMIEQARFETGNWKLDTGKIQYHTLGLDLAGSLTATGAVGAVLSSTMYNLPLPLGEGKGEGVMSQHYLYDGNGNIISTCNQRGEIIAKLAYSPFGELLSSSDPNLPFTFSTKAVDASGLSYYGYRFYNSELGRWLSRDPIEEVGGFNIYDMANNDPLNKYDLLGNRTCESAGGTLTDSGECCCNGVTMKPELSCCSNKQVLSRNPCNFTIFIGHTDEACKDIDIPEPVYGEEPKQSKSKIKMPRGSRWGASCCNSEGVNKQCSITHPGHEFPGIPGTPRTIKWQELMEYAWKAITHAQAQAAKDCKDNSRCCSEVKITVKCSERAKGAGKLYKKLRPNIGDPCENSFLPNSIRCK